MRLIKKKRERTQINKIRNGKIRNYSGYHRNTKNHKRSGSCCFKERQSAEFLQIYLWPTFQNHREAYYIHFFFFPRVPCVSHFQWTFCALDFNHTLPRSLYGSCLKRKHHHFQHPSCIHPYNQISCIPCIGKQILNHWTIREVLPNCIFKALWWYNRASLI